MNWTQLLTFTVLAALVTVIGNLIALYLKDFLIARSFERWKAKQALVTLYDRYRKLICLAAQELGGRCYVIAAGGTDAPRAGLGLNVLRTKAKRGAATAVMDDYYLRYRYASDIYRLCCFLGWIELYRRDLGLLDAGRDPATRALDICLKNIQADIADGGINPNLDWATWTDALIFREEQRAIGHRMIATTDGVGLMDFGSFFEQLERDPDGDGEARWFLLAARFFADLQTNKDFRLVRMQRLVVHLTELRELLQPESVSSEHLLGARELAERLRKDGYLGRRSAEQVGPDQVAQPA